MSAFEVSDGPALNFDYCLERLDKLKKDPNLDQEFGTILEEDGIDDLSKNQVSFNRSSIPLRKNEYIESLANVNRSKSFARMDSIEKRNQLNKYKDTIETLQTSQSNETMQTFENGVFGPNQEMDPNMMEKLQLNFNSVEDNAYTEQEESNEPLINNDAAM